MAISFDRPMPVKTPTTAPFWDALAEHRVVIQYSPSSQAYVFYPRVRAPRTLADDLEWREISGMGTLYSFTVARRPALRRRGATTAGHRRMGRGPKVFHRDGQRRAG